MKKKKIPIIFILVMLIITVLPIVNSENDFDVSHMNSTDSQIIETLTFSKPQIQEHDQYVSISISGTNSCLNQPGRPVLPALRKTYVFPLGTKVIDVAVSPPFQIQQEKLSKKIILAGQPFSPDLSRSTPQGDFQEDYYDSSQDIFPGTWFYYTVGCGLYNGKRSIILTVQCYPVRYAHDTIYYTPTLDITITYRESSPPVTTIPDGYNLLIIAPRRFSITLKPFMIHKELHGLQTKLVTLEEIYEGTYFPLQGRDDAEKVKYFIKNALDEWGITYVLLVGGRKPGLTETWFVPVRYVNVFWVNESHYISDLYFADVYDGNYSFSSWDTDGNDTFSEWPSNGSLLDEMDLYPDVYVGRWACRNKFELRIMIRKTMRYENRMAKKKVVVVGGDNFEAEGIEGEIVGDKALTLLPGFEAEKVYASTTDVTPFNIMKALGKGATFLHLHGHGTPTMWSTHKPDNFDEWEKGLSVWYLPFFFNREYPIFVIGGCHTAMFNLSMNNHPWSADYVPEGLGWWFARKIFGGGVASLGYTCFPVGAAGEYGDIDGDGINEQDCVETGYGYMELGLFSAYGVQGMQHLGDCWGWTVSNYIEHFTLPLERWHLHTIQGFVLLGDPSLII